MNCRRCARTFGTSSSRVAASLPEALAVALGVSRSELLSRGDPAGLNELLDKSREQIAAAFGTGRENVRIMIEL